MKKLAYALVNRDIPAGATAVGVPCRIIEHGNMPASERGCQHDELEILQPCDDTYNSTP